MIVFVCTGNICRSPMAEGFAKELFPELSVTSGGTHPVLGSPPTSHSQEVMAELGFDITFQQSTRIPHDADLALCMTNDHVAWVEQHLPGVRAELLSVDGHEIADPYGESEDVYRTARDEIETALRKRFSERE